MDAEITRENRRWVSSLGAAGPLREAAYGELHPLLLRVARSEARRRAPLLRLDGPELDDIAHQATADAMMALGERLDRFRGEARFTTWATRFVIFYVATRMNRHSWCRYEVPYPDEGRPSGVDADPEDLVLARELAAAVSSAVRRSLSARQRLVFVETVLRDKPVEVLAAELGSTRNALYKVLFDARRKLRLALVAEGYLPAPGARRTVNRVATSASAP